MTFFGSGPFWFFEGILFCLVLLGIRAWAEGRALSVPVWKWALTICWLLYCGFTLAFIGTCLGEAERHAALLGGAFFGLIAVISGVGLYRLVRARKRGSASAGQDA